MDCLDVTQAALYLTTYGLSAKARRAYEQHLAKCPVCREKINRMRQRLDELEAGNQRECAAMRGALEAYALGELPAAEREKVEQHTRECHACEAWLKRVAQFPEPQAVAAWEIPVTGRLVTHFAASRGDQEHARREDTGGLHHLAEKAAALIREIRLSLTPLSPAMEFRGTEQPLRGEFVTVEHAGGDLVVNAGRAGVIVELYSNQGKYLDDGQADDQGRVLFPEMKPGLYKIRVQGHSIAEIKPPG